MIVCRHCLNNGVARCDGTRCDAARPGPYTLDQCRRCWVRLQANGTNPHTLAPLALPVCRHLGADTGRRVSCPACRGHTELFVFACDLHGSCTPARPAPGIACCAACPDRKPGYPAVVRRSLAFFCYPVRGSVWRRSCERLVRQRGLFNGRLAVAVATDGRTEPAGAVREALGAACGEVREFANDPSLREVVALPWLLEGLQSADPGEAFLLCHAKGVTKPVNDGVSVHPWTDIMWETLLDHWPAAEAVLRGHPVAGSFLKEGAGFPSAGAWHYSGSFCWLRSAELYRRDWRRHDRTWWGIESYPALHFGADEAGVVFHRGTVGGPKDLNLYDGDYLAKAVLPALEVWRREHAHERRDWT